MDKRLIGDLSKEVLDALLETLPAEITFVDEDGTGPFRRLLLRHGFFW